MDVSASDLSLAESAVTALLQELEAYPKPGLVSLRDSGSHADMDHLLMRRSAEALFGSFADIAAAGRAGQPFATSLIPLGVAAEREMLRATSGVNTHRGAIFTLGMLVAAKARAAASPTRPDSIRSTLLETWGDALRAHASLDDSRNSHGALVRRDMGAGGARTEAARGFPGIFETGLPAYLSAQAAGLDANAARIQVLFTLMAAAEDTNVLFRGGMDAATFVRRSAEEFLASGGCSSNGWFGRAEALHREFIRRNISPGGCADLLAGTLLIAEWTSVVQSAHF